MRHTHYMEDMLLDADKIDPQQDNRNEQNWESKINCGSFYVSNIRRMINILIAMAYPVES